MGLEPAEELLPDGHVWWRVAQADWTDPLDTRYSMFNGGRWNAPGSYTTLYLNEDVVTARINMQLFADSWPYDPEDLIAQSGPVLVEAVLPRNQVVADAHTPAGIRALGLPATYPDDAAGNRVTHAVCQPIGATVRGKGLRGIRCRSAQTPLGAGRELAWFPANTRSVARRGATLTFEEWFWG